MAVRSKIKAVREGVPHPLAVAGSHIPLSFRWGLGRTFPIGFVASCFKSAAPSMYASVTLILECGDPCNVLNGQPDRRLIGAAGGHAPPSGRHRRMHPLPRDQGRLEAGRGSAPADSSCGQGNGPCPDGRDRFAVCGYPLFKRRVVRLGNRRPPACRDASAGVLRRSPRVVRRAPILRRETGAAPRTPPLPPVRSLFACSSDSASQER